MDDIELRGNTAAAESYEEPVCGAWQQAVHAAIGLFLLLSIGLLIAYRLRQPPPPDKELQEQIKKLSLQVQQLKQEQAMPTFVLNRYRNSIGYIFGVYHVGFEGQKPALRARISGTGFVVGDHLLATNRHVAEPWYEDPDSAFLLRRGATPTLEKLVVYFPGMPTPVNLKPVGFSPQSDVAVAEIEDGTGIAQLQALPLAETAPTPGELVSVVGYPMGVLGMVAKSPPAVYDRLAYRHDDQGAASELAALSLIRPSATCGHLGDVVGEKLIYDAPTAHGGSGGPVFDAQGNVIGINAAYLDGFSGGTMGISVRALKPLITAAEKH
jgi:S1-C subfamily serine protease